MLNINWKITAVIFLMLFVTCNDSSNRSLKGTEMKDDRKPNRLINEKKSLPASARLQPC